MTLALSSRLVVETIFDNVKVLAELCLEQHKFIILCPRRRLCAAGAFCFHLVRPVVRPYDCPVPSVSHARHDAVGHTLLVRVSPFSQAGESIPMQK